MLIKVAINQIQGVLVSFRLQLAKENKFFIRIDKSLNKYSGPLSEKFTLINLLEELKKEQLVPPQKIVKRIVAARLHF